MNTQASWIEIPQTPAFPAAKHLVTTACLWFTWLFVHRASLVWLGEIFGEFSRFNLLLLALVGVGLLIQGWRSRAALGLEFTPTWRWLPIAWMLAPTLGAIALSWWLDLEQFRVGLFLLGTYGLLGLHLPPNRWHQGLPLGMLMAGVVPFSLQLGVGLGFPARMLTAHWVEQILRQWQIAALSSQDILVLENGMAQVDLPCSGLKSLWTGTLFLLLATWQSGRRMGLGWFGVCGLHLGSLMAVNTGRVLVLVLLTQVAQQPQLGQLLHLPLGLLGFMAVCSLTWGLLQTLPRDRPTSAWENPESCSAAPRSLRVREAIALIACLVGLALIPQPPAQTHSPPALTGLNWPAPLQTQPLELTSAEQDFFGEYPGVIARKQRFQFQDLKGSLLLVSSPSWRAHHAPELCLLANGFHLDHGELRSPATDFPSRWLSLNQGQFSASYWFQSPHQTTDDFLVRMGQEISRQEHNWLLVSLLLETPPPPTDPALQQLLRTIHQTLDLALNQSLDQALNSKQAEPVAWAVPLQASPVEAKG